MSQEINVLLLRFDSVAVYSIGTGISVPPFAQSSLPSSHGPTVFLTAEI